MLRCCHLPSHNSHKTERYISAKTNSIFRQKTCTGIVDAFFIRHELCIKNNRSICCTNILQTNPGYITVFPIFRNTFSWCMARFQLRNILQSLPLPIPRQLFFLRISQHNWSDFFVTSTYQPPRSRSGQHRLAKAFEQGGDARQSVVQGIDARQCGVKFVGDAALFIFRSQRNFEIFNIFDSNSFNCCSCSF